MVFRLYKNKSDKKKVSKNLELLEEINGQFKEESDILNPHILIENTENAVKCNYVYIGTFKRYYYVKNAVALNSHVLRLNLHVDVLKTYEDEIRSLTAFVLRQENVYNVNFNDSMLPIRSDTNYKVYPFGDVPETYNFYITTTGGVN